MNGRNCNKEILVSAYLDGELEEDAVRQVEAHLVVCRGCSAFYEVMKADRDHLLEVMQNGEPPAHLKPRLFTRMAQVPESGRASGILEWLRIEQLLHAGSRSLAFACAGVVILAVTVSVFHVQHRAQNGKLLAEIDRSRAEWVAQGKASNPFNIDINGAPLRLISKNPFKVYLNAR